MKTGEMITALTNDREAKFKCIDGCLVDPNRDFVIGCDKDGYIKFFERGKFREAFFDIHNKLDWDWELIPQEVTWQEGIQGWLDGKSILIKHDGSEYTQSSGSRLGCFMNNPFSGFGGGLFRDGKWFILG